MGYYIKELYIDDDVLRRVPLTWHDPLTNPPTIPETSPIISVAKISPAVAEFTGALRQGHAVPVEAVDRVAMEVGQLALATAALPADDTVPVPTPITPIALKFRVSLSEADLGQVRAGLQQALEITDGLVKQLAPSEEQLSELRDVLDVHERLDVSER